MTYEIKTSCADCDHVEPQSRKGYSSGWLCMRQKNLIPNAITNELIPFMRCAGINGGDCSLFSPRRTNQINIPLGE